MSRKLQWCVGVCVVFAFCWATWGGEPQCRVEDVGVYADEKPAYELLVGCGGRCNVTREGRLLHIWADGQPVTAEFIASLKCCKAIESLWLGGDDASFAALAVLPDLPTLESINFKRKLTGKEDMQWVKRVPNVDGINLVVPGSEGSADRRAQLPAPSGAGEDAPSPDRVIGALTKLSKLRVLRLNGQPITDASGAHLAQFGDLYWLELNDTLVGSVGVKRLSVLKKLKLLYLDRTQVGDEGVLALAELATLETLTLNGTAITDKALGAFSGGPLSRSIRSLRLDFTAISDAGLKSLEGATALQGLSVANTRVTDAGLNSLRGMNSLHSLSAGGTGVTREGSLALKQRANKLQYAYVTEKSDTSNTAVATRPLVKARLKDGTAVEGLLMRFADGTYVVKLGDSLRSFQESEIASISFSGPRASGRATERERTPGVRPVRGDMSDEFARLGVDSVQQAVKLLDASDRQVRYRAAMAIVRWAAGAGTIIPFELDEPLIAALHNDDVQVRSIICEVLARVGRSRDSVISPLIETLKKDTDRQVAWRAAQALSTIAANRDEGAPSFKAAIEALSSAAKEHSDAGVRVSAIAAIGELGPKGLLAAEALRRAADDPNSQVQAAARRALAQIGDTLRVALRKLGADEETTAAIVALKWPQGVRANEEMRIAREAARRRLKEASLKNLDVFMAAVRYDEENAYWTDIARVIAGWGEPVLPALGKYAGDSESRVRRTVAMALGEMSLKTMPDAMPKLLRDPEATVRDTAALSLTRMVGERFPFDGRRAAPTTDMVTSAVPLLLETLAGPQSDPRRSFEVASTLGAIGRDKPEVATAMIKMLKESTDHMQRDNIVSALGRLAGQISDDQKIKPIVQALADAIENDRDSVVRMRAAALLGYLGPRAKAALPALKKAQSDADPTVARNAREAMGRIE